MRAGAVIRSKTVLVFCLLTCVCPVAHTGILSEGQYGLMFSGFFCLF